MIKVTWFSPSWFNTILLRKSAAAKWRKEEQKEYEANLEVFDRLDDYYDEVDERHMRRHRVGYQNTIEMADGSKENKEEKD